MNIAFLGLGVMGYPIAGHLSQAGHRVTVYNRTTSKAEKWCQKFQGELALTPAEAAAGADMVFACVGNDDDLRQVTTGDNGAFCGMSAGSVFVDHTTTSAIVARELSQVATASGFDFVDAPVSGGQQGAENGCLTVMCGASVDVFERVAPVISHYAQRVVRLGDVGSGQLCKMVNQICVAGLIQALAEGLNFATAVGLDTHKVVETISKGAAQSWQMENRHQTMLAGEYEHGFAVDWMRKDLAIVMEEAAKNGTPLPVTEMVDQFYREIQAMGGGRWDTSSLMARLQKLSEEQQDTV